MKNFSNKVPTASAVLADQILLEMVYDRATNSTALVRGRGDAFEVVAEHRLQDGRLLVPFSATNNLLAHDVVLFPAAPVEYGSKDALVQRIAGYIRKYVDLTPVFEAVASHYVLLTWLSDAFPEVPYLRVRGEPGSGKTRFLLVLGSICSRPIFASGASTVSPIFRMLDSMRGTLVLDEADFRFSDEKAEIIKILNNGTAQGFPVLRAEQNGATKEFNPHAYHVFGPKLIATRNGFDDPALETRFIAETFGSRPLRPDIPISLPPSYRGEAQELRNQLLLFRLRSRFLIAGAPDLDRSCPPRLLQMLRPLLCLIDDQKVRSEVVALAREQHAQLAADRSLELDARLLGVIAELWVQPGMPPTVGQVAQAFVARHPTEPLRPHEVGRVVRKKLGLRTVRRRTGYEIAPGDWERVQALREQLGVPAHAPASSRSSPSSRALD